MSPEKFKGKQIPKNVYSFQCNILGHCTCNSPTKETYSKIYEQYDSETPQNSDQNFLNHISDMSKKGTMKIIVILNTMVQIVPELKIM